MYKFKAKIEIIGINPFVFVPENVLKRIFKTAQKEKGKIPVCGMVNDVPYKQTLVKYSGDWRLYINTTMLKNSPKRIGETITITINVDTADRKIAPHSKLLKALEENKQAFAVFKQLSPSLQHEIIRYIANLKTEQSIEKNANQAIDFLLGKCRFIGRNKLSD